MKDIFLFREHWLVSVFAWAVTLALLTGIFFSVDYIGGTSHNSDGFVNGRSYSPAYVSTTFISDGKGGGYTQVIYHPESWSVIVFAENEDHVFSCSRYDYETLQYKSKINCTLVTGCITNIVYAGHLK